MDWIDSLFSQPDTQAQPTSPAYDPAVGLNASAPFGQSNIQQPMQTDARTGATNGTPNPDFFQTLMRLLAGTRQGQNANMISQTFGGPNLFGGPTKYTSTYNPGTVPQAQPMQGAGGGDAGGKIAGIASLIEMY